ncbi:MAG: hypothetical protein J6A83_09840 [Clostridia bacterium]|nr:hypothetical protein [Clostridia bacterium]
MTYHNAVKYIKNAANPVRTEGSSVKLNYLCSLLGEPHRRLNYIRMAGSNGKTICSAMLSSVLAKAGYDACTLNMSISDDPRDNIRLNTHPVSIPEFTELVNEVHEAYNTLKKTLANAKSSIGEDGEVADEYSDIPRSLIDGYPKTAEPTGSEILLLCALLLYRRHECKLCIIESAHNEADPSLFLKPPFAAVICGTIPSGDRKQINKIKSYIRKGVSEVISAPQDTYAYKVISDTCAAINCRLSVPVRAALTVKQLSLMGTTFIYNSESYKLSLCGRFQTANAVTVIETVKMLRRYGYNISPADEKLGMAELRLPSRFEVLSVNPTVIADSTYKDEALEPVCESLFDFSEYTGRYISLCLPCNGQLIENYLTMLGTRGYKVERIYTVCQNDEERARQLADIEKRFSVVCFNTAKAASKQMLSSLTNEDTLLISGNNEFTGKLRLEVMRYLEF